MPDTLQRQHKMVIDQQVKVRHEGVKDEPTHDGKIELVRTTEGSKQETDTLGFRSTGGAGTYVEVPLVKVFFPALLESAAQVPGTLDQMEKLIAEYKADAV